METVRIEMDICVTLPESIVLSRKYGKCQMETDVQYWRFRKHLLHLKLWTLSGWRRVYSISLSENFASLLILDAVRMETDIEYWPFRKHYLRL